MGTWTESFPGLSTRKPIDADPNPTDERWKQFGDADLGDTEVGLSSSSPPGGVERLTPIAPASPDAPRYAVWGLEASQWDAGKISIKGVRVNSGDDPEWLYGVFFNYNRSSDDGRVAHVFQRGVLIRSRVESVRRNFANAPLKSIPQVWKTWATPASSESTHPGSV